LPAFIGAKYLTFIDLSPLFLDEFLNYCTSGALPEAASQYYAIPGVNPPKELEEFPVG
jgi:hypothetical protein